MYKASYYNVVIPIPEMDKYLLYNTLSNSLLESNSQCGQLLSKWEDMEFIPDDQLGSISVDEREKLINHGFIHDSGKDGKDDKEAMRKRILERKLSLYDEASFNLTINTTNLCNMGCPYCFQGEHIKKESEQKRLDEKSMDALVSWMKKEIEQPITNKVREVSVSWFGGEPLLQPGIIQKLSKRLIDLCRDYGLEYTASVITNGIRLKSEVWNVLEEAQVRSVQVTIDGDASTHETNRPMLGKNARNYYLILENLQQLPNGIDVGIRCNTDKKVAKTLPNLLEDLDSHGVWPWRASQVDLHLAHKTYHNINDNDDPSFYMSKQEFYELQEWFRDYKLSYYNAWAEKQGKPPARLEFKLPNYFNHLCAVASAPYAITLDDEGYLHRCWETVNDKTERIQHITDGVDLSSMAMQKWLHFSQLDDPICSQCKFLPVCGSACPKRQFDNSRECTEWKFVLPQRFRKQYLMAVKEPDKIKTDQLNLS